MWMRWNDSTHIFEQSTNDGASWAVLPLNASIITEGSISVSRLPANLAVKDANNNFSTAQNITGGLTVTSGLTNIQGGMTVAGGLTVSNTGLTITTGGLTVNAGGINVTGTSAIIGATTITGNLNVSAGIGVSGGITIATGALQVTVGPTSMAGGLTVTSGGLNVTGTTTLGVLNSGVHSVTGSLSISSANAALLGIQITTAGTLNYSQLSVGNDNNSSLVSLFALSSNYAGGGDTTASVGLLRSTGVGGLNISTTSATAIRFFTNTTERVRITATGELYINTTTGIGGGTIAIATNGAVGSCLGLLNTSPANGINYILFYNSAAAVTGNIAQSSVNTVVYGTSSDKRLKIDKGLAIDLTSLRKIKIHDFEWKADGIKDRGVFAQDTYDLFPRAILKGSDELNETGQFKSPWMADYSKFVPDLIVGWQEHDREIVELKRLLNGKSLN